MPGQSPMDLLRHWAPEFAEGQMAERKLLFEHPDYQQVPARYKLLIGIGVAAALGSDTCSRMWSRLARDAGVTPHEIVEAILVARYMRQATTNDFAAGTLAGLLEEGSA